ncbi:hypothetical protein HPULCUR_002730 [Helicostylum pulchrum]|uniref:Uncharacterized protein n=1 Tax=Helicostylum pulchrum TaxID=562976 RepID=A0ABP9XTB3_9FUNG
MAQNMRNMISNFQNTRNPYQHSQLKVGSGKKIRIMFDLSFHINITIRLIVYHKTDELFGTTKTEYDSDPINDPEFMAFLSSYSTTSAPCTPQPTSTVSDSILPAPSNKKFQATNNNKKSNSLHTKIGRCAHPKHVIYRQEKYTLLKPTASADEKSVLKALPRRGRPPKGSKPVEFETVSSPIVELTVRPLPKRLEKRLAVLLLN